MASLKSSPVNPFLLHPFAPKPTSGSRNLHQKTNIFTGFFHKPTARNNRTFISFLAHSETNSMPMLAQEFLENLSKSDGENLPAVRTYENDLGRLVLIGDVDFEQALTAAAADGGEAADEHIGSRLPTMVVETVFPGITGAHSTVSTRLFLPAKKVKEKAKKLRSTLTADILSGITSRNILAMTFRQVVLRHLWSFELALFEPGTVRNMEDLANPREVPSICSLSSSDERVVSVLAEAVCSCALESIKRDFRQNTLGVASNNVFHWFQSPKRTSSADSSVHIYEISQDEVVGNAKYLLEGFNSIKGKDGSREAKSVCGWWPSPIYSRLDRIGSSELCTLTSEYLPAYRLQIDADKFKNVKFKGWKKSANNRWEVLLSHSQMVGLADILDMYYEDTYTLLGKLLPGMVAEFSNFSQSKRSLSLWKMLSLTLAGGFVLVSISILAQFCRPQLFRPRKFTTESYSTTSPDINCCQQQSKAAKPILLSNIGDVDEIQALCTMVVKTIKDELGWSGGIMVDADGSAWTGELPSYFSTSSLKFFQELLSHSGGDSTTCSSEDVSVESNLPKSVLSPSDESNSSFQATIPQDIASYQVVLSRDGKIIGFQPTSRMGVNHWASNPLSKSLYGGRKLSPGFLEPGLKIPRPDEVFLIELLMSINPSTQFALARPVR